MLQGSKANVGHRLRVFRERQGLSLRALAERCGLSINAISRIERGENSPTVSSLNRLADALSVPITDFFIEKQHKTAIHVKNGLGLRVRNEDYTVERLGIGLPGQQMEPFLFRVEGYSKSAKHMITHPGEEFVHCLEGEIEYCIGEQKYLLKTGDSLLFDATLPHSWRNLASTPGIFMLVFQAAQDNSQAHHRHRTG